jgi:hypothetical protein
MKKADNKKLNNKQTIQQEENINKDINSSRCGK